MSAGLTVPRLFNVHCFAAAFESVEGAREGGGGWRLPGLPIR